MATQYDLFESHSWPLYEAGLRMPQIVPASPLSSMLDAQGIARWSCRLQDNALSWSPGVFEIFGLPSDRAPNREYTVALYLPESRDAMEELRDYAIRHQRGFTLDARIRRLNGDERWMRLNAMPFICERRVVRLFGTKQDVTAEYHADASADCPALAL